MNKIIKFALLVNFILIHFISGACAADQVYFYHTDPVGTPMAISDANGQVVWRGDYKPFGEESSVSGALANDRRFAGKEKDEETGLYYFGARCLDTEIGRFSAIDPVRVVSTITGKINDNILKNTQLLNYYTYCLNNPYRRIDKFGTWAEDVHAGLEPGSKYGTFYWIMNMGNDSMNRNIAEKIAISNNITDIGETSPKPWGDFSRHFNIDAPRGFRDSRLAHADHELRLAVSLHKVGDYDGAYAHLGTGMHSLQDYFAHRDYVPYGGVIPHPGWYDKVTDPRNTKAL